ncbi:MAG TPA: threonylcarbamoyl-AMP synthase [Anaerolineae bacterium]|nr:threonylcarbamoyl-AMP synthase [Anaerolineae bacterium]
MTQVVSTKQAHAIDLALNALQEGKVIAIPTDTVYGIACLVDNTEAIKRIYEIKGREKTKALPVLIGEYDQLLCIAEELNTCAQKLAKKFWPGALTLIISRNPKLPNILSPYATIGVRMPEHDWLRKLINQSGPLAATSANLSGTSNPRKASEVLDQLEAKIEIIMDGGTCRKGIPSTIVDCTGEKVKILRQGGLLEDAILSCLHNLS